MANETKIINKPKVTVDGNISIDDSTPIDTAITGTPSVSVTNTPTVTANSTIQNATLAVTKSGTWAVDSITADVSTKSKTSYSDSTTSVDYWLGLYNDNQLIKKAVTISASTIVTVSTFQTTSVDTANGCIQITEFLDGSSNVTGRSSQVITWTQAHEDLSLPSLGTLSLNTTTIVEDSIEGVDIGTLSAADAVGAVDWSIETNPSSLENVRIVGDVLEADSGGIDSSSGTYVLGIKALDSVGQTRTSNFTITVTSAFGSTKSLNITTAAAAHGWPSQANKIQTTTTFSGPNEDSTISFFWKLNATTYTASTSTSDGHANIIYFGTHWSSYIRVGMAPSGLGGDAGDLKVQVRASAIHSATYTLPVGQPETSNWHHCALVLKGVNGVTNNGDQMELWWDGVELAINNSHTMSGTWGTGAASTFAVGSGSYPSTGHIDEVTLWDRAFDSDEMAEIYNSGSVSDYNSHSAASDLLLWWRFGEGSDAADGTGVAGAGNIINDMSSASSGANDGLPAINVGDGAGSAELLYLDDTTYAP